MIHPRDHILPLTWQARSDMTDLSKVSCKVRVNGGAPTTYTSATNPAVGQGQDCTFAYHIELPAGSFADGARVSRTWLYDGVPYTYGDTIVGPAAVDGARYTAARGDKLDDLDAAVSTRASQTSADAAKSELDAVKAKTDTIGAGTVTGRGPVIDGDTVVLYSGDDYLAANGNAVVLTGDGIPDLTGFDTLTFTIAGQLAVAADAVDAASCRVELAAAATAGLKAGAARWDLSGVKDGDRETISRGPCIVYPAVTD